MTTPIPTTSNPANPANPATKTAASDSLGDASRRITRSELALVGIRSERGNLRWFLLLAGVAPWPVWWLMEWRMALAASSMLLLFYAVGRYLNVMHVRSACQHVEDARVNLIRLERRASRAPGPTAS